jgi:DNA-binding response OmpR family regulator
MGLGAYADRYHQADDRTMHTSVPLNDEQKNAVSADEKRWNTRALIVDDDVPIRELLIDYLARFNILATGVTDGAAMRVAMQAETFDVVVLDLMLPGEDGLSLCRWLRGELEDSDPHAHRPLRAGRPGARPGAGRRRLHVQAVRAARAGGAHPLHPAPGARRPQPSPRPRLPAHPLRRLGARRRAAPTALADEGVLVPLSNAEFRLLWVFLERPRRVLNREQLLDAARGRTIEAFDRSIDLLVSRIRQKLGDDPRTPRLIKTVRGEGYLFDAREIG